MKDRGCPGQAVEEPHDGAGQMDVQQPISPLVQGRVQRHRATNLSTLSQIYTSAMTVRHILAVLMLFILFVQRNRCYDKLLSKINVNKYRDS